MGIFGKAEKGHLWSFSPRPAALFTDALFSSKRAFEVLNGIDSSGGGGGVIRKEEGDSSAPAFPLFSFQRKGIEKK
jgi:hypothetical protein